MNREYFTNIWKSTQFYQIAISFFNIQHPWVGIGPHHICDGTVVFYQVDFYEVKLLAPCLFILDLEGFFFSLTICFSNTNVASEEVYFVDQSM